MWPSIFLAPSHPGTPRLGKGGSWGEPPFLEAQPREWQYRGWPAGGTGSTPQGEGVLGRSWGSILGKWA